MYKRLQSRKAPHARVLARFQALEREVMAEEEGMFELWMEPSPPISDGESSQSVELMLLERVGDQLQAPVRALGAATASMSYWDNDLPRAPRRSVLLLLGATSADGLIWLERRGLQGEQLRSARGGCQL